MAPRVHPVSVPEIKQELVAILASQTFRQSPQLSRLLSYVCSKAILEESDQVTEYTIGVDVFGKPENFKESKDSYVRVEIHRLRKRLTQFYEGEGLGRPLRMLIPPGHYTPEFIAPPSGKDAIPPVPEQVLPNTPPEDTVPEPPYLKASQIPDPAVPKPNVRWSYVLSGLAVLAVLAGFLLLNRRAQPAAIAKASSPAQFPLMSAVPGPNATLVPASGAVRLMAGYSGPAYTDGAGIVWGPDRFFEGGRPARRTDARTARTNNPLLFQNSRIGDFSYAIPLRPGIYELHLYFIESEYGPEFGNGENDRTIFIHINGRRLVPEIDIESDAMGMNIADERVFRNVVPDSDGKLHIAFESGKGVPLVNAIEVVPATTRAQNPIRLVAQPMPVTGHDGVKWQPDSFYLDGRVMPRNLVVTGTADPGLFAMERFGHFSYAIPVDTEGRYTVTLYFAELYFSTGGTGGVGSRIFNVTCNGMTLLDNFDIFREAGLAHAVVKTFHHIKPTAQGKLNLMFEPVVNYAVVSAIEVTDETQ